MIEVIQESNFEEMEEASLQNCSPSIQVACSDIEAQNQHKEHASSDSANSPHLFNSLYSLQKHLGNDEYHYTLKE